MIYLLISLRNFIIFIESKFMAVENQAYLIQFINKCANLYELHIENSHLNQNFFEELPGACSLRVLGIWQEIELNFKFIHRMFNFSKFNIDQQLNLNDLKRLCNLKSFSEVIFKFEINETIVTINKLDNLYSYIFLDSNFKLIIKKEMNMFELIRCFNSMNSIEVKL